MTIEEFTARTGYKPTYEEYREIEQSYYDFNGDKDEFCKLWALNQALTKNLSYGLRNDIVLGLNYILSGLYENGYKDTNHYRQLRNLVLSIDF